MTLLSPCDCLCGIFRGYKQPISREDDTDMGPNQAKRLPMISDDFQPCFFPLKVSPYKPKTGKNGKGL